MADRKSLIKIKPKKYKTGEVVKVSFMIMHPMETGMRKDKKTGQIVPADYISDVQFLFDGKPFTTLKVWESVSTNPVFTVGFKVPGNGALTVTYKTNTGESGESTKKVKPKG